jgi:hypothetical protein
MVLSWVSGCLLLACCQPTAVLSGQALFLVTTLILTLYYVQPMVSAGGRPQYCCVRRHLAVASSAESLAQAPLASESGHETSHVYCQAHRLLLTRLLLLIPLLLPQRGRRHGASCRLHPRSPRSAAHSPPWRLGQRQALGGVWAGLL